MQTTAVQPTLFEFANETWAREQDRRAQERALAGAQRAEPRALHTHSLEAHEAHGEALTGRRAAVLGWLRANGPATDRQVRDGLMGRDADMNTVRPRITELVTAGYVHEIGEVEDPVTHCKVRIVRAKSEREVRLEGI